MRLPERIERAIEIEAAGVPGKELARAAEALSTRYRTRDAEEARDRTALTPVERVAYAIVRAPATYAAVARVLGELRQRAPALRVESVLDLGAGPGAATWAALTHVVDMTRDTRVTLIEQDRGFIELGRRIMTAAGLRRDDAATADAAETIETTEAAEVTEAAEAAEIEWQCADLRATPNLPAHDLVMVSYALGELDADAAQRLAERAWVAARQALVIVEPGTPRHFSRLLDVRDRLIRAGAIIAAPCPHDAACPMSSAHAGDDWCHMPARVERTSLHRRLKSAALPYEDEKFSYVVATRNPTLRTPARIVHRPEIQKGFVALTLCTTDGLRCEGVPRSRGDAFRRARKADWGDAWEIEIDREAQRRRDNEPR